MTARIVAAGGLDRRSRERVDVVLRAMKRAGVIDSDRYQTARDADLDFRSSALRSE
jgi:membrane peptidoglycan carboxypeptidase